MKEEFDPKNSLSVSQPTEETKGPSSLKKLIESGSGKFKCKACMERFVSKKILDKHCRTADHKLRAKMYTEDLAKLR